MAFDLGTVVISVVTTGGAVVAAILATRGQAVQANSATQVAMAATTQKTEEVKLEADKDFRAQVLAELARSQANEVRTQERLEKLNDKSNVQATEIAELRGEVKILRETRTILTAENAALKVENTGLRRKVQDLDEENEQQGLKLAELNGRIAQLTGVTP